MSAISVGICPTGGYDGEVKQVEPSPATGRRPIERRGAYRYPVRQELQYWVVDHTSTKLAGVGRVIDMSSSGIFFSTEEALQLGRRVALSVEWPARLNGTCPLKLVAAGPIVRSERRRAAMRIQRYEFRTRGSSL